MSWINGQCQGDRRFECTYADFNNFNIQWCRDRDFECPIADDGGALIKQVDHQAPPSGGW
jgi:hypothetical protein